MKITVAKSAGFCFGVRRALEMAFKTAANHANVYMLGDIVHNEDVIKEIENAGIKKIQKLSPGQNRILIIRAHGTGIQTIKQAQRLGYTIVDATCPMVKEIHKIARDMEDKGYKIIVIGDKKHDEVRGIIGQLKAKAIVIDPTQQIPIRKIKKIKKAVLIVQSTQNIDNVFKVKDKLQSLVAELKFFNTICKPTSIKQKEIKDLPLKNDIILVVGSKASANTKRLYQISESLNRKSYWVESKKDIRTEWVKNALSIGITAGASTPDSTIKEIVTYIEKIS